MIKLHHTVVAKVAVTAAQWPKDITSLAKFKLEENGVMSQANLQKMDACFMADLKILFWETTFYGFPTARWDYTWFT